MTVFGKGLKMLFPGQEGQIQDFWRGRVFPAHIDVSLGHAYLREHRQASLAEDPFICDPRGLLQPRIRGLNRT